MHILRRTATKCCRSTGHDTGIAGGEREGKDGT
jgi:hypothetical protein